MIDWYCIYTSNGYSEPPNQFGASEETYRHIKMWAPGKTRPAGDVGLSAPETEAPPLIWQQYYRICILWVFFYCVKVSGLLISAFDTRIIYCLSVQGIIIILQTYQDSGWKRGLFIQHTKINSCNEHRILICVRHFHLFAQLWRTPGEPFILIFILWKKMPIPLKRPLL